MGRAVLALVLLQVTAAFCQLANGTPLQLYNCNGSFRQTWEVSTLSTDHTIRNVAYNDMCWDIDDYGTSDGSEVWLWECHTSDKAPSHQNQEWVLQKGQIISTLSNRCLDATNSGTIPGTRLQIWDCSGAQNQQWYVNATDSTIRGIQSGLCIDVGSPLQPTCSLASNKGMPFCNTSLSVAERAADIVGRMTATEKVGFLTSNGGSIAAIQMPAYQWWSEGLHGVASSPGVTFGGVTPCATSFPQAASFDTDLFKAIGTAISDEARAMSNVGNAGLTFWAPNLNIFRDPRWGRGQETPGEDPYLTSQYVLNFVTSMQEGEDKAHLKVSSCCKHYAAYSLEDWDGMDRYHFDAICSVQDLTDTYLVAFEACISPQGAGASGVCPSCSAQLQLSCKYWTDQKAGIMCSYNAVNGIPSCADTWLLTDLARNTWGFEGYITSDCGAVDAVIDDHKYTTTSDATVRDIVYASSATARGLKIDSNDTDFAQCSAVLTAGMDMECGNYMQSTLGPAISDGSVPVTLVDQHLVNDLSVLIRLGMFDPVSIQPYLNINTSVINSAAHQALALQAALEGTVLLKNLNNVLPLSTSTVHTVAVIGPNGNATTTMQGNYYGTACNLISPLAGIESYAHVVSAPGCDISDNSTAGFTQACTLAQKADVVVLVMGLDQTQEREGVDRTIISFPGVQDALIGKVASCAANKPVILVVMSGGPVDLTNAKGNPNVDAIMWVGYPGQAGGQAIAQVLFGDYSPAGRLDHTWYPAAFANQEDMGMRPNSTTGNPGRGYRYYTGEAVYAFGTGLSYTNFTFSTKTAEGALSSASLNTMLRENPLSALRSPQVSTMTITVTNVGKIASDCVVLGFIVGPQPGQGGNPLSTLVGFSRLAMLSPGANATLTFPITARDLSYSLPTGEHYSTPGVWRFRVEDSEAELHVY